MKFIKYFLFTIGFVFIVLISFLKISGMNINDFALKTLGLVKKLKGDSVKLTDLDKQPSEVIHHDEWTQLLKKHVAANGKVNYEGFQTNITLFNSYLNTLSNNPPGNNWNSSDKIAYWINVYNAFTIKLILDHYPVKSIKDISSGLPMINSPWDIKFFKIGDVDFDLNTVEHEILRKEFEEPRIHFAINCASFSCPKLRTEAFEGDQLEVQLEEQAKDFIFNPDKNDLSTTPIKLSKIFNWFESDFEVLGGVPTFIQKYKLDFDIASKISHLDYDWTLN